MPGTTVGDLIAKLQLKGGDEFVRKFNHATNRIGKGVDNLKKNWIGLSAKITGTSLAVIKLVDSYAALDKKVREIGTLLRDVSERSINKMTADIKRMAIRFGQALGDMAKARYDIISAGFTKIANSARILRTSAKLAVGGVSTVGQTAKALTKILNSFRLSARQSGFAADVLFTTVRLGQTTIDELVGVLGHVTAMAHKARLGLKGLGAAMAVLTAGGLSSELSAVAFRGALLALVAPMGAAKKAMQEAGIETKHFNDGTLDLLGTLKQFKGLSLDAIRRFIPDVRAANAVSVLSENLDKLGFALKAMDHAAGASDVAFQKMTKGAAFRIAQLKTKMNAAFTEMGKGLLPLYELAAAFLEIFADMPEKIKVLIVNIVALTAVLGTLKTVLTLIGISTGPIGWVIAGVTALAGVFVSMSDEADKATQSTIKLADANDHLARSLAKISENTKKQAANLTIKELKARQKELTGLIQKESALAEETRQRAKDAGTKESRKNYETAVQFSEQYIKLKRRELSEITTILNDRLARNKKDRSKDIQTEQTYQDRLHEIQFNSGKINLDQYVAYLTRRRDALKKHSVDYLNLDEKINNLLLERAQKTRDRQLEIDAARMQMQDAVKANDYNQNRISARNYLQYLKGRLKDTKAFSAEYIAIWMRIQQIQASAQQKHLQNLRRIWQGAAQSFAQFGESIGQLIADKALTGAKKWNEVGRQMLLELVNILEKKFLAAKLSALMDGIINFSTFLKNAPLIAAAEIGLASLKSTITSLAQGGVITKPTLALIGDNVVAGRVEPEVVAPQSSFNDFANQLLNRTAIDAAPSRTEVVVNQSFNTPLQDKRMAQKMTDDVLRPQLLRVMKRGGRIKSTDPFKR